MFLRRCLTIEFVHNVVVWLVAMNPSIISLNSHVFAPAQSLPKIQAINVFARIDRWSAQNGITGKNPPVKPVNSQFFVIGNRRIIGACILQLRMIKHVKPLCVCCDRHLDTVNRCTDRTVVSNFRSAFFPSFGCNQQNARSRPRSVNRRGSVLQHGDVLDVVRFHLVQFVERTGNSVDKHQRAGASVDGNVAANFHRSPFASGTG